MWDLGPPRKSETWDLPLTPKIWDLGPPPKIWDLGPPLKIWDLGPPQKTWDLGPPPKVWTDTQTGVKTLPSLVPRTRAVIILSSLLWDKESRCGDIVSSTSRRRSGASFPENQEITTPASGNQPGYQAIVDNPSPPFAQVSNLGTRVPNWWKKKSCTH